MYSKQQKEWTYESYKAKAKVINCMCRLECKIIKKLKRIEMRVTEYYIDYRYE